MDPPPDESRLMSEYQSYDYESNLSASIIMESMTSQDIFTTRKTRKQWTWFQYLIWVVPTIWMLTIYTIQLLYGVIAPKSLLTIYNIGGGSIGLLLTLLRIREHWVYIKPSMWVTEFDLESQGTSRILSVSIFILDICLFIWTIIGSSISLMIYIQYNSTPIFILSLIIINLIFQCIRYGIIVFIIKFLIVWTPVNQNTAQFY